MGLKTVLSATEAEQLAEPLKPFYAKQEDGTFVLDADVDAHPKVGGLKRALLAERENVKQAKAALKVLDGSEPAGTAAGTNGKAAAGADESDPFAKHVTRFTERLKAAEAEKGTLQGELRRTKVSRTAMLAIADADGKAKMLLPLLESRMDVDEKGKEFIRGDDGTPLLRDGWTETDQYLSAREFLKGLREDTDWAGAFNNKPASGGNTPPGARTRSAAKGGTIKDMGGVKIWTANP